MTQKKNLSDFLKNQLREKESAVIKGGRSYVPSNSGSFGYVNWDEVTIRKPEFGDMVTLKNLSA